MDQVRLQVTDDSGFLALVDPDAYSGFVAADWDLDALVARFHEQMAARRLLLWGTGQEGCWAVGVHIGSDAVSGERAMTGSIVSSRGRLLLTNYESLTMAAQFPDVTLPEAYQTDLIISVAPGAYTCRIVQRHLEARNWQPEDEQEFSLSLEKSSELLPVWPRVPWSDDL